MENGIYKKLATVQTELRAPKNQFNEFSNFNYRSCEDILNAVKPLLSKVGAIVGLSDEIEQIGERYYIKATAAFYDVETGEAIKAQAYAREQQTKKGMDESQITGAASSYARKYALNGLFAIDNTKDADSMNNNELPPAVIDPTPPAAGAQKYYCIDCGQEITGQTARGKKLTPADIADKAYKQFGRALCWNCATKAAAIAKKGG